jgi:O-antigen ligase
VAGGVFASPSSRPWAIFAGGAPTAWAPLGLLAGLAGLVALQLCLPGGTADVFQTRQYLLRTLLYAGAFGLTLAAARSRLDARWVLMGLVLSGVLQALLAVVLFSVSGEYLLFFTSFLQGGRATGTYPNPDHLAGLMELCLAAGLGLMVTQFSNDGPPVRTTKQRLLALLKFVMSRKMLLRLMLVVMVIALVMTHSRMGNGAFFVSLMLVGALVAWRSVKLRQPALWLIASMVVVDVFVIGQLIGLDKVVTRLNGTEVSLQEPAEPGADGAPLPPGPPKEETLEQRLRPARATLQLVQQKPWLGHGAGTFETVFPQARTPDVLAMPFDHAHNDYVQQAAEVGLLGLLLWVGVGLLAGWRALRLLADDQPRQSRGVAVACLVALACLGLHSVVDFNLQIPANAFSFSVLLALPFGLPVRRSRSARSGGSEDE